MRIARNASHNETGAEGFGNHESCEPLGGVAAPTFFWGGEAARARVRRSIQRLILMGVWRDSFAANENEETGVIRVLPR
jgi:hypothetical protein